MGFYFTFFFGLVRFGLYYIGLVASYCVVRGAKFFLFVFFFEGEGELINS